MLVVLISFQLLCPCIFDITEIHITTKYRIKVKEIYNSNSRGICMFKMKKAKSTEALKSNMSSRSGWAQLYFPMNTMPLWQHCQREKALFEVRASEGVENKAFKFITKFIRNLKSKKVACFETLLYCILLQIRDMVYLVQN